MSPRIVATLLLAASTSVVAAPVDRRLDVVITVEGKQDWRNVLQWSKATTTQRYEISTTLRSDGTLEGANLLDLDTDRRLAIKSEYLRRRGLALLAASGLDPNSPNLQADISQRMQKESFACKGEGVCLGEVNGKYATLLAAAVEPDNSHLFDGDKRYLFFSGFQGCANRIRAVNQYQASGETAYGREKDKIFPYALSYDGDYAGSATDQKSLCSYFTVTTDTKDQKLYVENVNIPGARGKVVRTEFGRTTTTEAELPVPAPLQGWVNEVLRETTYSGTRSAVLPLNLPLDGNSTVMGAFTGEAKVTMTWKWAAPTP